MKGKTKMLIIMKERGDLDKKWGILKVHEDDMVEIIKHPTLPEGEKYHKSTLSHLILTTKTEMDRRLADG